MGSAPSVNGNAEGGIMAGDAPQLSRGWQIAKIIGDIALGVGAIAIPFVIHFSTLNYTNSLKEREIGVRYVEVAIGILREDPSKQNTRELRKWAIDVINKHSTISLSAKAMKDLMERRLAAKADGSFRADGTVNADGSESHGIGGRVIGDGVLGD